MNWRIGELLVRKKLITWEQLEEVLTEQKTTGELTGEILIRKKYILPFIFYKVLAEKHMMQFVEISRIRINPLAIEMVPQSIAEKFKMMPLEIRDSTLIVGIGSPLSTLPDAEIKKIINIQNVRYVLCMPNDIQRAIQENYQKEKTAAR